MSLLYKPLALNILTISIPLILFYVIFLLLHNSTKKSANIYQFRIKNQLLSLIFIMLYISLFVVVVYILRVLNLPRNVNLRAVYTNITIFYKEYAFQFAIKGYFLLIVMLLALIVLLSLWKTKKLLFAEMHKWFILASIVNHKLEAKFFWVFHRLGDIHTQDLLAYFLCYCSRRLSKRAHKKKEHILRRPLSIEEYHDTLPWYHHSELTNVFYSKKYAVVRQCSPFFFVAYDCVFNEFVLTHVFYYLLFFVPLMLIRRIIIVFGSNAHYLSRLIWNIYYSPEPYVYLIPPNLKLLFDDYLMSGLTTNFHFNDITGPEEFLLNVSHFKVLDKEFGLYHNVGQCLGAGMEQFITIRTKNDKQFYRVIEDDEGNITEAEQWILLADNRNRGKIT